MFKIFKGMSNSEFLLKSPVSAHMIDITAVNDPVFSEKMMGDGVAFESKEDKCTVCSPADGVLSVLFPTRHAFGITMTDGVEVLIHIGIDTVHANGNGFRALSKKQGDTVKAGDPIIEVNLKQLVEKYDTTIMLIITNSAGKEIKFISSQSVLLGQKITK